MEARLVRFGEIEVDGVRYAHDVVVERGRVERRRKRASKPFRDAYGHTPLTLHEHLPWDCRRLVVGTGADGQLPIAEDVLERAKELGVELVALPTDEACRLFALADPEETAAVLHVTC